MKVDVAGLMAAAQTADGRRGGRCRASAPANCSHWRPTPHRSVPRPASTAASQLLWGSACAQAASLHTAAAHLVMIAAKFGGQEEINKAGLNMLLAPVMAAGLDAGCARDTGPRSADHARCPHTAAAADANLNGEAFSQLVTVGSSAAGWVSAPPPRTTERPPTPRRSRFANSRRACPTCGTAPSAPPPCPAG